MLAHILQVAAKCAALRTFTKRQTVLVDLIDLSLLGKQGRCIVVAKDTGLQLLADGLIAAKAVLSPPHRFSRQSGSARPGQY